jgi:VCBS repeat-containing protein
MVLTISTTDNGGFESLGLGTSSVTTTIIDDSSEDPEDPEEPDQETALVAITGAQTIIEGDTSTAYTVSVDQPASDVTTPIIVQLVYSGQAEDGTDFTGVVSVTIPAGSNSTTFTLDTIDDLFAEPDENFTISIGTITDVNFENIAPSSTQGSVTSTIVDDSDTVTLTLDDVSVDENQQITYTASVSSASTEAFTVTLDNGVEINFAANALTGSSAPQSAQGEDVFVDADSFTVAVDSVSGGNFESLDTSDTATVSIADTTNTVTATLSSTLAAGSDEDAGSITYTVTLTNGDGLPFAPTAAAGETFDFTLTDGTTVSVVVAQGASSGSTTLNWDGVASDFVSLPDADVLVDSTTIALDGSISATNNSGYENLVTAGTSSHTIDDSIDTVTLKVIAVDADGNALADPTANSGAEGASLFYKVVVVDAAGTVLTNLDGVNVDVSFANLGTTTAADYTPSSTSVEIGAVFSAALVDDIIADSGEQYTVGLVGGQTITQSVFEDITLDNGVVTSTITDNDTTPTIGDGTFAVSEEGLNNISESEVGLPDNTAGSGFSDTTNAATETGTLAITGNGTAALTASITLTSLTAGLTSEGNPITWAYDGTNEAIVIGSTVDGDVIRISLNGGSTEVNATGVTPPATLGYTVELLQPVDHLDNTVEDDLDLQFNVAITDGANTPIDTGLVTVTIEDDAPEMTGDVVTIVPGGANVSGDVVALFGGDGPGSLALNITTGATVQTVEGEDLFLDGELLSWTVSTDGLTATAATASGTTGFVLAMDASGTFTVENIASGIFATESDFLAFPAPGDLTPGNAEIYGISDIGGSAVDVILQGFAGATVSTVNNSTAGFAVGGGQSIDAGDRLVFSFHNNLAVPNGSDYLAAIPNGLDTGLVTGFQFEIGRVQGAASNTADFSIVAYDQAGNLIDSSDITLSTNSATEGTMVEFTSTVPVSSFELIGTGGNTFTIFLGAISVFEPADHALNVPVTITDGDDDSASGNIAINIDQTITEVSATGDVDDVPVVSATDASVDEDDIASVDGQPGGPSDLADPQPTGTISYNLGADSPVASIALDADTTTLETLTGRTVATNWDESNQQLIGYGVNPADAGDTSDIAFTIDVSNVTDSQADYAVTLLQPLRHHDDSAPDDAEGFTDQILSVTATVTDADGSVGNTTFTVSVDDDTPESGVFNQTLDIQVDNLAVSGLTSAWSNATGGSPTIDNQPAGQDDVVSWQGSFAGASNYTFDDNDALIGAQSVDVNSVFEVGTFTHNNFETAAGSAIESVNLDVSLNVVINGYAATVNHTITFDHNETTNIEDDPVASRDIVTINNASTIVPVTITTEEGTQETYNFQIIGFVDQAGNVVDQVFTNEGEANAFSLVAQLMSSDAPEISGQVDYGFGADGAADQNAVAWADMTGNQVQGQYGVLTVQADGSYTYAMDQTTYDGLQPGAQLVDSFEYVLTDGDGDGLTSTLSITINGNEAPQAPDLAPTLSASTATTQDEEAAGEGIVDTDSGSMGFTNFSSATFTYDGGLGAVSETTDGSDRVFSANDGSWELRIDQSSGAYTFTQFAPFVHGPGVDAAQGVITVSLADSDNDTAQADLTLTITDAGVTAAADSEASVADPEAGKDNIVFVIDTSGSMDDTDGDGVSRLQEVKNAIGELFESGSVNAVYIVAFASNASSLGLGDWFTDLDDAMAAIDALDADGGTDYDAALEEVMTEIAQGDFPAGATANKAIFMTDGQPTQDNGTGSDGIVEADTNNPGANGQGEETQWIEYLLANGFDEAYAVGFGGIGESEIAELEPIAWTPGETADTYGANELGPVQDSGSGSSQSGNFTASQELTISSDGSSLSFTVEVRGQSNGNDEVSWQLLDSSGAVVDNGAYSNNDDENISVIVESLDADTYTLVLTVNDRSNNNLGTTGTITNLVITEGDGSPSQTDARDDNVIIVAQGESLADALDSAVGAEPVTGNVLANDSGVDAPLRVQSVTYNGATHNFATDGSSAMFTLTEGGVTFGTVTLAADGTYSYELVAGVELTAALTAALSYVVTDQDGDTDTATLTLQAEPPAESAERSAPAALDDSTPAPEGDPEPAQESEPDVAPTIINATSSNDSLVGLAGPDTFVWDLADVVNTVEPQVTQINAGGLSVGDTGNGNGGGEVESASFIVADGESVEVSFTLDINDLTQHKDSEFTWTLEKKDDGDWEEVGDDVEFDGGDADANGQIIGLEQSFTLDSPGEYRLVFETEKGVDAQISAISLTQSTAASNNTDTITDFDVTEDVLDLGDLLTGGGSLSLSFDGGGNAQVTIADAGGNGTDQIITLSGVTESALEAALGLDNGADANAILSEMINQSRIITD